MPPTLQTHIQGVHTCTHQTETQRDKQRKPCITDVIWQAWFWFYSFGHETVSSGEKEIDTRLYLIPYTTLQLWRGQAEPQPLNISWRNVRMAKTKMWEVQTSRYKQVTSGVTDKSLILGTRMKSKREAEYEIESKRERTLLTDLEEQNSTF